MDKEQVKGKFEKAKGYVKEKAGEATNNPDLETEGTADRAEGEVRDTFGKAKDKARKIADAATE